MKMVYASEAKECDQKIGLKNAHKEELLRFMRSFSPVAYAPGYVTDIATGSQTGIVECDYVANGVEWTESDIYNLEHNDLKINDEFCTRVLEMISSKS